MYTIISIIVLILSWLLFRKASGSMKLTQLNLVSWAFYYFLIAQSFIASILVINGWADYSGSIASVSNDSRFYGWVSVQYTMIVMPLGMLLINCLYGYKLNNKLFLSYINSPLTTLVSKKDSFVKYPLYILSLISLLAVSYVFIVSQDIPLLGVFHGLNALELAGLREDVSREFAGSQNIRIYLGLTLTPILSYIAYAYWHMTKSIEHFIWFLTMFVLSFFVLTFDLSKGPFAAFVLGFLFLNVLIKGGVKKQTLFLFGGGIMVLVVAAYVFVKQVADFGILYKAVADRIFLQQGAGTYLSFEYFPQTHDFIGFSSLSSIFSSLFGFDTNDSAARIIMAIQNPLGVKAGFVGVMNSLFIQEAWANFGWSGVIIAPIYVGMFVQFIYMFFLKSKKTPMMLGILTYLSYKMPITIGFNEFLFNRSLLFIAFIFMSVYVIVLMLKSIKRNMHKDDLSQSNFA